MSRKNQPVWITINPANFEAVVRQAGQVLQTGGVIVHATETVYGLAARWDDEGALNRVAQIKGRSVQQPFSIMVSSVEQIAQIAQPLPPHIRKFLERLFPAPVTVLVPRTRSLPVVYWNQFPYLGFRLPDHPLSRELVVQAKVPLITTSANFSGQHPPKSVDDIPETLLEQVDMVLDSGPVQGGVPSTIVKISQNWQELSLVREGPVPLEKILAFFRADL